MTRYEIPLGPSQRTMTIALQGGVYQLRFFYADAPEAGWTLDISDSVGNPILCGVAVVPGVDLLSPYAYLGIGGKLFVVTDQADGSPPSYSSFGVNSHVYYEVET